MIEVVLHSRTGLDGVTMIAEMESMYMFQTDPSLVSAVRKHFTNSLKYHGKGGAQWCACGV